MSKKRGFEVVSTFSNINIPVRKTEFSAGYDLEASEDCYLYPGEIFLVPTGLKCHMQPGEYLGIHVRSSIAIKKKLILANGVGVIDADYYDNESNEGHIMIPLFNADKVPVNITKGQAVAQGVFYNFLTVDEDVATGKRKGGTGSTDKGSDK